MRNKRLGATVDLTINRADGTKENHIVENIVSNGWLGQTGRFSIGGTVSFSTSPNITLSAIAGTFSQSGLTITRNSGIGNLLNVAASDMVIFGTGQHCYKESTGSATTFNSYTNQTVGPTTLSAFFSSSKSSPSPAIQTSPSQNTTGSYLSGITLLELSNPYNFTPTVSSYVFNSLYMTWASVGNAATLFHMPGTVLSAGDSLTINTMVVRNTWDAFQPKPFATSPLTGITATGRVQRLRDPAVNENAAAINRIYLTVDATKYTIPEMIPAGTSVLPSALTIDQAIVATSITNTASVVSNEFTSSSIAFGILTAPAKAYKQIIWGSTTLLYGVIEFDTPYVLSAGQVITVGGQIQMVVDHNFNF